MGSMQVTLQSLRRRSEEFLAATGGVAEGQEPENSVPTGAGTLKKKVEFFESRTLCRPLVCVRHVRSTWGLGLIVGKSGQGRDTP